MTNSDINPLADTLVYEDMLPLSWGSRECGVNYMRVAEHNEHVVRCVNLLGEQIKEKMDDEYEAESVLARVEAKLNLLLDMVSRLDRQGSDIPEAVQVRLASAGIEWKGKGQAPAVGDNIWVNLYIDSRIPEAMELAARVVSVSMDGETLTVCARFEEMGEVVQDQLEKMIFRYHRRMVAQSRSG